MPVTQIHVPHIALLSFALEDGYLTDDLDILEKYAWLGNVVEDFTSYKVHFYRVIGEENKVTSIAGWDSIEQHYRDFHQSEHMSHMLEEFGGVVDIRANWHANIPYPGIQFEHAMSIGRFFVLKERRKEFEIAASSWIAAVEAKTGTTLSTGWRLEGGWQDQDSDESDVTDGEEGEERTESTVSQIVTDAEPTMEWNAIIPWESVEQWRAITSDAEAMRPFFSLEKCAVKMELHHLEPLELPDLNEEDDV